MDKLKALVVTVTSGQVELAADVLWGLGVVAIEERVVPERPGEVELWTSLGDDSDDVVSALEVLDSQWVHRFEPIDAKVSETWRAFAQPIVIDQDLLIYPAWAAPPDTEATVVIGIEPGATFGLGDHPTTVLSLRALKRAIATGTSPTVLDVGCGSGVLAIAACRLGARRAVAIDISPAAVPTTSENAQFNGVSEQVAVSTTPLELVDAQFEIVVANILAPTLIELANDLRRVMAPNATLIISGILSDRHQHVLDALIGMTVTAADHLDGWAAITLCRDSAGRDSAGRDSAGRDAAGRDAADG